MTEQIDTGSISDGCHTFNELYEHRHALVLALMKAVPQHSWFSRRHHDGGLCFGDGEWFIVGAELPESGAVTYHLPMRLWGLAELTGAAELERGRPWDGHTANDVVHRLKAWASRPSTQEETEEDIFRQNLSSLRGRFERIVFAATSSDAERISHIELAGRLINAVVLELAPSSTKGPTEAEVSEWINSLPLWHGATRDELTNIVMLAFRRFRVDQGLKSVPRVGHVFYLARIIQKSCEECTDEDATNLALKILQHPDSRWVPKNSSDQG